MHTTRESSCRRTVDVAKAGAAASTPPLAGEGQGGGTHARISLFTLSPPLSRKREREQTESAAHSSPTPPSPDFAGCPRPSPHGEKSVLSAPADWHRIRNRPVLKPCRQRLNQVFMRHAA